MSRFVFVMLDGVGVGELPDSAAYGDAGSDTLGNLSRLAPLQLPHLQRLGLGNIAPLTGVSPVAHPLCLVGRLAPLSAGKDTTVGHWEHLGLVTSRPFPTYPDGFPDEVLGPFQERIGRGVLGNKPASGTAIMADLGEEHMRTGFPIVYTSADSVFQIAAHTDVVPLERLYEWCETARSILTGPHAVARVIARPFRGRVGEFVRTKDRRDFSLAPPTPTYLDLLHERQVPVLALGKISEVFVGRGITTSLKVGSNEENLALLSELLDGSSRRATFDRGLLFTNLVDFDMVWGHRNDADGFAQGLRAVDGALPRILASLAPGDRLLLSADHGVDPTTISTDHSREYVPLLLYPRPPASPAAVYEGHFADTGATVFSHLTGETGPLAGEPVTALLPSRGWRRYTPVQSSGSQEGEAVPGRVGPLEAREGADWLRGRLGEAPAWAVVLGSGLGASFGDAALDTVSYERVPHWRQSAVAGHENLLSLQDFSGHRLLVLQGRVHRYEGFDLSETQLPVRTLATWGVRGVVLTSAAGAVSARLSSGGQVVANEIIDLQEPPGPDGPVRRPATDPDLADHLAQASGVSEALVAGVHAAVPGPHYETAADLRVLDLLGADSVSMSLAGETRAAREEGLRVAALAVITNAGPPTHADVLAAAASASTGVLEAVRRILNYWI